MSLSSEGGSKRALSTDNDDSSNSGGSSAAGASSSPYAAAASTSSPNKDSRRRLDGSDSNSVEVTNSSPSSASASASAQGPMRNSAFVFIKPHANTADTRSLVASTFASRGLRIESEGELTAEQIDKGMLIDQHYYSIASKATLLKPRDVPVDAKKFEDLLGVSWDQAIRDNKVYNAVDACAYFGVDASGLKTLWNNSKFVKLGGGFYCGLVGGAAETTPVLDQAHYKAPIYVYNAFFMEMRALFVKPGSSIHYYIVDMDPSHISWKDFRGKILGHTDPKSSAPGSLRSEIFTKWKELGLEFVPNITCNGVHASASPFEALTEKMNWLKIDPVGDAFGKQLMAAGVTREIIEAWSVDPQVNGKSLFDQLEDIEWDICIERAVALAKGTGV